MANPVYSYLHTLKVSDIVNPGPVITLKTTDWVEKAIKVLSEHKILSVPVIDERNKLGCVGLVDILDIVHYIEKVAPEDEALSENELKSLEVAGRAISMEEVGWIINASGKDPYIPVYFDSPITMALNLFADGIHRVLLFDQEGGDAKVLGAVAQMDIIRHLASKIKEGDMQHVANLPITKLGLADKPVFTVNVHDTVLAAVKLIVEHKVSGLGVLSGTGRLVGNFSASDCKGIYQDSFPSFLLHVGEFLDRHSPESLKPICCTPDATLGQVISELADSNVHHLFIVDVHDDFKLHSLVSATDIMRLIRDLEFAV